MILYHWPDEWDDSTQAQATRRHIAENSDSPGSESYWAKRHAEATQRPSYRVRERQAPPLWSAAA